MDQTGRRRRWLLLGPIVLLAIVLLGLRLSRARAPDTAGSTDERRSTRPAGPEGETAPVDLADALRPPDEDEIPLAPPSSEPPPGIPRTPEIDRLANLAGRQIGDRLRLHFDVEAFVHGGPVPPLERIAVSPETIETLIGLLDSEDAALRRDAAIRLSAAVLRPEDLPLLRTALERELLSAKERDSRHAALALAYALAAQGDRSGPARIEQALVGGERRDDPDFRREAAIVLGMIADEESGPVLRDVLRTDPDRSVRAHAAQGLGKIGGDENRDALALSLVRDDQTEVRAWSALGYGRAAAPDGTQAEPLRAAAGQDAEPVVRAASLFGLGRAGGSGASRELMDAYYADAETFPRLGAIAGLTQRKNLGPAKQEFLRGEGVAWLAGVAHESEDHVTLYFTARTLRRIPGETSHGGILAVVDSKSPDWVRAEAVRNLARHDATRALPELRARLTIEPRPNVRKAIDHEIRRIERRAARNAGK